MARMAIKRMLMMNPGSPREMAAKGRVAKPSVARASEMMHKGMSSNDMQGMINSEAKRRLQFAPKRVQRKKF